MGVKEQLQKEIDRLERYAKFYLNILLALLTGLTGLAYNLIHSKILDNASIIFTIGGILAILFVIYKINKIDKKENELLE